MVAVITGMMVIGMFSVGAYAAALGDIPIGRKDQDRKRALEAAKAGIEFYAYHLYRDSNYWTYCDDASKVVSPGISLQGMNRPAASYRSLPTSSEQFQIELMTKDGSAVTQSACLADPGGRLLRDGVLRIRSTGKSRGQTRQIVATFRRNTFLDYLWYTNWETSPPAAQADPAWAATNCNKARTARRAATGGSCSEIQFPTGDSLAGPMHTEDDSFLVCGSPTFGRAAADNVEVALASSASNAYVVPLNSNCANSPDVKGTTIAPSKSLDLPPDNQDLADAATYTLTGQSCATFNADGTATLRQGMTWNGSAATATSINCDSGGTVSTVTLAANTVIYAKNGTGGCTAGYSKIQKYPAANASCGDLAVRGVYGANVTAGAADDVVIVDDLTKPSGGNQMMGLIANNYVRLYHPAYRDYAAPISRNDVCQNGSQVPNTGGNTGNPAQNTTTIANTSQVNNVEAAVLALNGSFIADNWACGSSLGTLNLTGNIAQYWRGPVGTGSGSCNGTGYCKNYKYDDRLKYRQPPAYLDPDSAAWHLLRQSEQSPVK